MEEAPAILWCGGVPVQHDSVAAAVAVPPTLYSSLAPPAKTLSAPHATRPAVPPPLGHKTQRRGGWKRSRAVAAVALLLSGCEHEGAPRGGWPARHHDHHKRKDAATAALPRHYDACHPPQRPRRWLLWRQKRKFAYHSAAVAHRNRGDKVIRRTTRCFHLGCSCRRCAGTAWREKTEPHTRAARTGCTQRCSQ